MPPNCQRIEEACNILGTERPRIALDTNCVLYYIKNPPVQPWANLLDKVFQAGLDGRAELYVSTVVVSELLAQVHFASRQTAGYDAELDLLAILNRHFEVLAVDGDVARAAGRLRGTYTPSDRMVLATSDALIGGTSISNSHTLFLTNDARLAAALPNENCLYLKDAAVEMLAQAFPARCVHDEKPIRPGQRAWPLSAHTSLATLELGSVKPQPPAGWKKILANAFAVRSALNEPCVLFVLMQRTGRKTETVEVLFWHEGLEGIRPARRIMNHLRQHLGYSPRRGEATNATNHIHALYCTSIERERERQSQPSFLSKSAEQRAADCWKSYLAPLWRFRESLRSPQTTWLICENAEAKRLKTAETLEFLEQANNVLGWRDD